MSCLFCQIADHQIPATILFEDSDIIAFSDINPQAKVHIVIIPKKHISAVSALTDLDASLVGKMITVARDLATKNSIDTTGYRLVINSGADASQAVDHLHLHLLGGNKLGSIA